MEKTAIADLGAAGAKLFGLGCATHIGAIVKHFAGEETITVYEELIEALWRDANRADVSLLRTRLEAVPECAIDDPYCHGYYAMRALGVVSDALDACSAVDNASVVDAAMAASDGAASLVADLAYETTGDEGTTSLDQMEDTFQARLAELIAQRAEPRIVRVHCEHDEWPKDYFRTVDEKNGWVRRSVPG